MKKSLLILLLFPIFLCGCDSRMEVKGKITKVQDSFWETKITTIQPTNAPAVKVSGIWGKVGDEVWVKAHEITY